MTRVLTLDPDSPASIDLEAASAELRRGGLVAFPTETVYGLGADATNAEAVRRIFAAKGRPATNPLIVHVDGVAMARTCVSAWPAEAEALADAFWPGPLTLVLPRSGIIPDVVTAGGDTVGVRVPANAVARGLIASLGRPIAAPSANRSTRVSPTRAAHVLKDLEGRVDLILDAGPCAIGLESTVLDLTEPSAPLLLRPGRISGAEVGRVLGRPVRENVKGVKESGAERSPGRMAIHYAPRTHTLLVSPQSAPIVTWPERAVLIVLGQPGLPLVVPEHVARVELPEPAEAGRRLYDVLHECDDAGLDLIVLVPPPDEPAWRAVRDRIRRAAVPFEG